MSMEKLKEFNLIEGTFAPDEAGKILFSLIENKITYHQRDAFSIAERFNGDVSHSKKRVADLKNVAAELKSVFQMANEKGWKLKLKGTIEIMVDEV